MYWQVETSSMTESKPNQVKVPVAVLRAGETRSIQTVLEFPDSPVIFSLVEGIYSRTRLKLLEFLTLNILRRAQS